MGPRFSLLVLTVWAFGTTSTNAAFMEDIAFHTPRYASAEVSPMRPIAAQCSETLIDPISPVLGTVLRERIQSDPRQPDTIFAAIEDEFANYAEHLMMSADSYLRSISPGLSAACQEDIPDTAQTIWTLVEPAAIPLETLATYQENYFNNLDRGPDVPDALSTREFAVRFQLQRETCRSASRLTRFSDAAASFCDAASFGLFEDKCTRFAEVNERVLAPEIAFPRTQFSINGVTRHVYRSLLSLSFVELQKLLHTAHKITNDWVISMERHKWSPQSLMETIATSLVHHHTSARKALLVLAYAFRNIPSLDVEYALSPKKALLLEIYFWQFKKSLNRAAQHFSAAIFPNAPSLSSKVVYHFTTAALHACELREAGFSVPTSIASASASKIGYKLHKLAAQWNTDVPTSRLITQQDSLGGVAGGRLGAQMGARICRESP